MAAAVSIAYTATPLAAGVKLFVFATRQLSQGVNFQPRGAYKLLKVSAAAQASPLDVTTEYIAKFGAPVAGKKILFLLKPVSSTGVPATPVYASKIIV